MGVLKICLAAGLALSLLACATPGPLPGTPEFAAAQVSRGYDCGVRVDRDRVLGRLSRDERPRFLAASASFAVKAYKSPRRCEAGERETVRKAIDGLANPSRH